MLTKKFEAVSKKMSLLPLLVFSIIAFARDLFVNILAAELTTRVDKTA